METSLYNVMMASQDLLTSQEVWRHVWRECTPSLMRRALAPLAAADSARRRRAVWGGAPQARAVEPAGPVR